MINIKRLLLPTDFSDASKNALRYAIDLAKTYKAELHLLTVVEPVMYPAEMFGQTGLVDVEAVVDRAGHDDLAQWRETLVPKEIACTALVLHGKAYHEIVQYAIDREIDLIVIATHGRSGVSRWVWGSVAERILRTACVPVLMVRAPGCVPGI